MGMDINSGEIYPLRDLDDLKPGDILLNESQMKLLEGIQPLDRLGALKSLNKAHENERRQRQIEKGIIHPSYFKKEID